MAKLDKYKCKSHPKYKGKKEPKYKKPCAKCLSIYLALHKKPRVLPMPTKKFKDKSKYSRKTKHREDLSE